MILSNVFEQYRFQIYSIFICLTLAIRKRYPVDRTKSTSSVPNDDTDPALVISPDDASFRNKVNLPKLRDWLKSEERPLKVSFIRSFLFWNLSIIYTLFYNVILNRRCQSFNRSANIPGQANYMLSCIYCILFKTISYVKQNYCKLINWKVTLCPNLIKNEKPSCAVYNSVIPETRTGQLLNNVSITNPEHFNAVTYSNTGNIRRNSLYCACSDPDSIQFKFVPIHRPIKNVNKIETILNVVKSSISNIGILAIDLLRYILHY
ncbi:hypothetical protein GJ496_005123 [Pomphorhynchus laevis]|nr:hypothetical protein GJ496_005123 [Pomphorhynchus laevis]